MARAEERAARRMELTFTPDGEGGSWLRGRLDPAGAATVRAALDPLAPPRPSAADGPDPRPPARRRADALVEPAGGSLTAGDAARTTVVNARRSWSPSPTRRCGTGSAPRRWTTAPPSPPPKPAGWPATRRSSPPSSAAAARSSTSAAAGDCSPAPLRRALALRDRGCAFPGCDRPLGWCDAHHITGWANGGATTIDNGVLLCGHHHRLIERRHWEIIIAADGTPEFRPPPWTDPHQRPLRNHMHRRE